MKRDLFEPDDFEADFARWGAIECEELDERDMDLQLEELMARVAAARDCGA